MGCLDLLPLTALLGMPKGSPSPSQSRLQLWDSAPALVTGPAVCDLGPGLSCCGRHTQHPRPLRPESAWQQELAGDSPELPVT